MIFNRGLNDKESRTQFTHVANLGAKNIYRIFAGGNHSWVVIDDIVPINEKYTPPSPVGCSDSRFSQFEPSGFKVGSNPTSPKPPSTKANLLPKFKADYPSNRQKLYLVNIHVTYTDTQMVHRFVTFEADRRDQDLIRELVD